MIPVDGPPAKHPKNRKLNDRQQTALQALRNVIAEKGKPLPAGFKLPASLRAVSITDWREETFDVGAIDRDDTNPREAFLRVKRSLHARNITAELQGFVRIAE